MPRKGADIVIEALKEEGVEIIFGHPGGAIMEVYDALYRDGGIRHILARHEQGAGHMAEGYAKATGKVGVAMSTSGPGATNLVTAIADAYMDSVRGLYNGASPHSSYRQRRLSGSGHSGHNKTYNKA